MATKGKVIKGDAAGISAFLAFSLALPIAFIYLPAKISKGRGRTSLAIALVAAFVGDRIGKNIKTSFVDKD